MKITPRDVEQAIELAISIERAVISHALTEDASLARFTRKQLQGMLQSRIDNATQVFCAQEIAFTFRAQHE